MSKKSITLATFITIFSLSEKVVVIEANDETTVELFRGSVEDLDPYYLDGKNPLWTEIRGKHVEFSTVIGNYLHVYVR